MIRKHFPDDGCHKCEGLLKRYITLLLDVVRLWLYVITMPVKLSPHALA